MTDARALTRLKTQLFDAESMVEELLHANEILLAENSRLRRELERTSTQRDNWAVKAHEGKLSP